MDVSVDSFYYIHSYFFVNVHWRKRNILVFEYLSFKTFKSGFLQNENTTENIFSLKTKKEEFLFSESRFLC